MSMEALEEIESYPAVDESGDLLDANMIPTAATEVVMSGDGIARRFAAETTAGEEEEYQYEYAYEDDPEHMEIEEEEVVVTDEADFQTHWKGKKLNLYDVLDGKMYMEEEKPAKGTRITAQTFRVRRGGDEFNYTTDDFRIYPMYPLSATKNPTPAADRMCQGCGMTLRRSVYYHHARMIREKGACNLFTPQRFPCPQCEARSGTLEKLCQHMEQIHNAPTQIKTVVFTNDEDFRQFRTELEGKGGNFRMARGNKKSKKGTVQYFRCNRLQTLSRAQTFRPVDNPPLEELPSNRKRGRLHQQQEMRPQSAKQVIRTENSCTAFYNKALLDNGTIEVRYCDHHLHDDEKLRLPDAVRQRVIELARKNLPHVVILMIVKDERFKYCERNSANDRRIQDMKTQDVRQVLAGNNRAEKTRAARNNESANSTQFEPSNVSVITPLDEDPTRPWTDVRPTLKVDRASLSHSECRYLDLFENNRDEIMAKLNERSRLDQDKKMLFDSFIHRLSSSQEILKNIDPRQLPPNDSTLLKLKKAFSFLTKIEDVLLNPRRENANQIRFTSYIRMMEDEARRGHETVRRGENGPTGDEIDVVGIDEEEYLNHMEEHHMNLHDVEGEEEVGYEVEEEDDLELRNAIAHVQEEEEFMTVEGEQNGEDHEEEDGEQTVTRAGRIVKKKTNFDS